MTRTWKIAAAVFSVLFASGIARELLRLGADHRSLDLLIHFSAAGLGVVLAHGWVQWSMTNSEKHLGKIVVECLTALHARLQDASSEQQIPLPIPYILTALRDADSRSFGYFDGKLMGRDPRLWLDLSLDQALKAKAHQLVELMKDRTPSIYEGLPTEQKAAQIVAEMSDEVNKENARRAKLAAEKAASEATRTKPKTTDEATAAKMASDVAAEVMKRLQEPEFLKASEEQIKKAVEDAVKKALDKTAWTQVAQTVFELVKEMIKSSQKS